MLINHSVLKTFFVEKHLEIIYIYYYLLISLTQPSVNQAENIFAALKKLGDKSHFGLE